MNKLYSIYKSAHGYEANFIYYLYLLVLPLLLFFTYLHYANGSSDSALINSAILMMLTFSMYCSRKGIRKTLAKHLIVFSLFLLHITALVYGSYANSAFFFFFLFPIVALFLLNQRIAFIWIGLLLVTILSTVLILRFSAIYPGYNPDVLLALIVALAFETYIVNYSQLVMFRYKEDLERFNTSLMTTNQLVDKYFLISRTNKEGKIIHVNDAYLSLTGYSHTYLLTSYFMDFCKTEGDKCLSPELFDSLLKDKHFDGLVECTKKDGTHYWVDTHIVMEYDENDVHIGFLIFQQDVTQKVKLEKVSITDTLTQINNRMYFDEVAHQRLSEYYRYETVSTLIICDIDDFKKINDKYGHLVGDEVLKIVAKLLKEQLRESDTLARWGGEEFAILLPKSDIAKAVYVAQKMCEIISAYEFDLTENITASFGITTTKINDTQITWFKRADDALYKSKQSGKNRVYSL